MFEETILNLLSNPGQLSLLVVFVYLIGDKIFFPMFKVWLQQSQNQQQIVQVASEDAIRNDGMVTRLINLLTDNLSKLTDNGIQQTSILNEIKTVTKESHTIVGSLPLTLEQRFNLLERQVGALSTQLGHSQMYHQRTHKMMVWMMQKLNLPVEELRKRN